jgi:hypothetical protein
MFYMADRRRSQTRCLAGAFGLFTAVLVLASVAQAGSTAGFIALEGSDATALHQDPVYSPELFLYLQGSGSSPLPVLVYNPAGTIVITGFGGTTVYSTTLPGTLTGVYSAVYIESPGGCCAADNTVLNGAGQGAEVSAFIAGGGNFSIENYIGGDYSGVVPGGAAAPFGSIEGAGANNGGVGGGPNCTDGETVTKFGMGKGFSQPPIDNCWSHQGYETSYWGPLGYQSIMASAVDTTTFGPGFTYADGTQNGSSFLALGGTLGRPTIPEPSTFVLVVPVLAGLFLWRRRASRA